ncbi:MAG TPA: hypothetical protein VF310_14470 [Vicinamibacteria bacterium]
MVWESPQDGSGTAVMARVHDAAGVPRGPEFRVNTETAGNQGYPAAAMDGAGNFMVVWSGGGIFGQRFNASAVPQGTEFPVRSTTVGTGTNPAVAAGAGGDFVVVWQAQGDGGGYGVFGRRFDASGAPQGPEFQVNTYTTGYQWRPSVSLAPGGGFVVVWEGAEQDGSATGIFGQRFDAAGAPSGTEFQVNTYTFQDQRDPKVAYGPNGGFVVVWDRFGAIGLGVFGRRYDAAGVPQGAEFLVNAPAVTDQYGADIAGDPSRGYLVAWTGVGTEGDTSGRGVFGRRLDPGGVPLGSSNFVVNAFTTSDQWRPSVVASAHGGFAATWESFGHDGSVAGVYGSVECARLHAVSPCRLVDTRDPPAAPLAANTSRTFPVAGRCGIPADARAVALNVVAVNPSEPGNLRLYPAGTAAPLASALNFAAGHSRANNAMVMLGGNGQLAVRCDMAPGATGSTHLVLDVSGYFTR